MTVDTKYQLGVDQLGSEADDARHNRVLTHHSRLIKISRQLQRIWASKCILALAEEGIWPIYSCSYTGYARVNIQFRYGGTAVKYCHAYPIPVQPQVV